ncbi:MAG: hypothetical protein LBG17_10210, partial [Bacteroidales bacterium]|nr:hypothetical protein [Bacteroidales bacterium]
MKKVKERAEKNQKPAENTGEVHPVFENAIAALFMPQIKPKLNGDFSLDVLTIEGGLKSGSRQPATVGDLSNQFNLKNTGAKVVNFLK